MPRVGLSLVSVRIVRLLSRVRTTQGIDSPLRGGMAGRFAGIDSPLRGSPLRGACGVQIRVANLSNRVRLPGRNFQIKKGPRCGPFVIWYSLGDSNPCYRRERAKSP